MIVDDLGRSLLLLLIFINDLDDRWYTDDGDLIVVVDIPVIGHC